MRCLSTFLFLIAFAVFSSAQSVVITEIMYNPPESGPDTYEYIELYNNGGSAVNLLGYNFSAGVEYTFTSDFMLGAGQYVLFATDSIAFEQAFGIAALQITSGSLSNSGELIELRDGADNIIDAVEYDDSFPWDQDADGAGASLELCDPDGPNDTGDFWAAGSTGTGVFSGGLEIFGSPGAASTCPTGPVVRFLSAEMEVDEAVGTVTLSVEVSNVATSTLSVDVAVNDMESTATVGADATFATTTLTFSSGAMVDTMDFSFMVIDDSDVEPLESLVFELTNPSMGVTVDGVGGSTTVIIADNDAIIADIVINEIMYSPPGSDALYEYLELYNNDAGAVNLAGYYFSLGIIDTLHDVTLQPGEYMVLAVDSLAYQDAFGGMAWEWTSGALSNGGETVELRDALGNVVDVVTYDDTGDWPEAADGSGSALVLCDPSSDNNLAASWIAGVQPTGVFISGSEILGSPGAVNDCTPPEPQGYTPYDIATVTSINANGVADSLGTRAELVGVVYGVNLRPGGSQFTIIDAAGDGIATFSNSNDFGYPVTEGDEVTIQGVISQFSGLTQINMDTVYANSNGNPLVDPTPVTVLGEDTESQLVQVEGVSIMESVEAGGGLNVTLSDGVNTYLMRVDFDTDITTDFINGLGASTLRVTGIGGQFDSSEPHDEGYQILPRYQTDIEIVSGTEEPLWASGLKLFPNPTTAAVQVQLSVDAQELVLKNKLGQTLRSWSKEGNRHMLDLADLPNGMYFLEVIVDGERVVRPLVKQ